MKHQTNKAEFEKRYGK